jgi:hypothetical protein
LLGNPYQYDSRNSKAGNPTNLLLGKERSIPTHGHVHMLSTQYWFEHSLSSIGIGDPGIHTMAV